MLWGISRSRGAKESEHNLKRRSHGRGLVDPKYPSLLLTNQSALAYLLVGDCILTDAKPASASTNSFYRDSAR